MSLPLRQNTTIKLCQFNINIILRRDNIVSKRSEELTKASPIFSKHVPKNTIGRPVLFFLSFLQNSLWKAAPLLEPLNIINKNVLHILEHIFLSSWYLHKILLSIIAYNSRLEATYTVKQITLIHKREDYSAIKHDAAQENVTMGKMFLICR